MDYAVYSNRGKARKNNEDEYYIAQRQQPETYSLLAVADGMGGHKAGEVASKIAINYLRQYKFNISTGLQQQIEEVIAAINREIIQRAVDKKNLDNMGTTMSMGIIYNKKLFTGHIGDSRIYMFRDDHLSQLTTDHTLVNELVRQKKIDQEEAFYHPRKNILTRALGLETDIQSEINYYDLQPEDILLFCTDGLSDLVKFARIETIIRDNNPDLEQIVNSLGTRAMDNGGSDNISLIAVKYN